MLLRSAADRCVALAALPLTGCSYNKFVEPGRSDQGAVGTGREPAAAAQRSDSEPGRDGQGLRRSTKKASSRTSPTRDRGCSAAKSPGGNDRGREPADVGARPAAGGRRELSAAEGQRAVQPADGRARRHREPARRRAHALQRARAGIQHVAAAVPGQRDREGVRLQGISVLRGAARSQAGSEGQLQETS